MTTDRLALAHVIEQAGIAREGAEKVASAIFDAIHDNVATKADIAAVNSRIDLARTDIAATEHRMLTRMVELEHRITLRGVSALVVAVGIILAAIRYIGHG